VITPCRPATLTTTLVLGRKATGSSPPANATTEEEVMTNWTDEALRAEADYRRERLHRMATHHRVTGAARRSGGWHRLLHRGLRH
jgi:hypothetical protein